MYSSISKARMQAAPAVQQMRLRGWRGGIIAPHRAIARLRLGPRQITEGALIASGITAGWIFLLPVVGRFWAALFSFWGKQLNLAPEVTLVPQGWGHVQFSLPCFGTPAGSAGGSVWWVTAAVTTLAFLATFRFGEGALPWNYLVRGFCLLQATALGYFAVASARFPHALPSYTVSMLVFSCNLIGLVPLLYAFTFYLLNFSLQQKIFLTLITMLHLVFFVPHQYLLHVYLLHGSILFMPLLYFVFGPFLDILAFVGFYSWGMSWNAPAALEI